MPIFSKTRINHKHERLELIAIHMAGVFDAFVYFSTLTLVSSDLTGYLIFDVFKDINQ